MSCEIVLHITNLDVTVVCAGDDNLSVKGDTPDGCKVSMQSTQTLAPFEVPESKSGVSAPTDSHTAQHGDTSHGR